MRNEKAWRGRVIADWAVLTFFPSYVPPFLRSYHITFDALFSVFTVLSVVNNQNPRGLRTHPTYYPPRLGVSA